MSTGAQHSPAPWRWIEDPPQSPEGETVRRLVDADGNDVAWGYVATPYDDDLPVGISAKKEALSVIAEAPRMRELVLELAKQDCRGDLPMPCPPDYEDACFPCRAKRLVG